MTVLTSAAVPSRGHSLSLFVNLARRVCCARKLAANFRLVFRVKKCTSMSMCRSIGSITLLDDFVMFIDIYHLFSHLILSYPFLSSLILSVLSSLMFFVLSSLILSRPFLSSLIFSCPFLSFSCLTVGLKARDITTYSGILSLPPSILSKSKCC